jgi:outer membrane lipoprotein-sorting protein
MQRTDDRIARRAAVIALLALAVRPVAAQSTFDLAQLTQLLAKVKAGNATFTEKRYVTMLERTLDASGRLSFEAPDSFVRETLKPAQERMAVVGNQVTLSRGSRSRTVPLDSVPEAAVIVEAIRGTLTGNREALERHFSASVTGDPARWTLELQPRAPRLRELVMSVRVSGQQGLVREVVVAMADGDRSVMSITPVAAAASAPS